MANESSSSNGSGFLATAILASATAIVPEEVISYGIKILSVFVLAVVAECGRRLVQMIWKGKQAK